MPKHSKESFVRLENMVGGETDWLKIAETFLACLGSLVGVVKEA